MIPLRSVSIVDLKVNKTKNNGVLYCGLIDSESGERLIQADLSYIMSAIKERNYKLDHAEEILNKVSQLKIY